MAENPLLVLPVLFGLSLLAAIVLFGFFKATAVIKTKSYQAGGAIAGFIIVFLMLSTYFSRLADKQVELYKQTADHDKAQVDLLRARLRNVQLSGTITPISHDTRIVVVPLDAQGSLADDGKFDVTTQCADQKGTLRAYILTNGRFIEYTINKCEATSDLKYVIPE
jgi:hypothetical protein